MTGVEVAIGTDPLETAAFVAALIAESGGLTARRPFDVEVVRGFQRGSFSGCSIRDDAGWEKTERERERDIAGRIREKQRQAG